MMGRITLSYYLVKGNSDLLLGWYLVNLEVAWWKRTKILHLQ